MSSEKQVKNATEGDILQEAIQKSIDYLGLEDTVRPLVLTGKTYKILKKIRGKFPEFDPNSESDILTKARSMGLTEEE